MNEARIFRYETHCHTAPVSRCAKASPAETARFYRDIGYDGIFLTNHFLDGNIDPDIRLLPYPEQIDRYFRDYEDALAEGRRIGLKVFPGVELSYGGTDFLVYGIAPDWYRAHPEIMAMKKTEELRLLADAGAYIVQAHPYREEHYIDHIRLFPRSVDAVETVNACQTAEVNAMGALYAAHYGLPVFYGSDNHWAGGVFDRLRDKGLAPVLAGMCSDEPVNSVEDFIRLLRAGRMRPFLLSPEGTEAQP